MFGFTIRFILYLTATLILTVWMWLVMPRDLEKLADHPHIEVIDYFSDALLMIMALLWLLIGMLVIRERK